MFLLFARTDPGDDQRPRGLGLPPRRRARTGDTRRGEARPQLLLEGRPRLHDARVGPDRLLHGLHRGFAVAMATLDGGRIAIAAQARRDRAGRVRDGTRVRARGPPVRQADRPSSKRSSGSSPTWRRSSTPPGSSSIAPPGCKQEGTRTPPEGAKAKLYAPRWRAARPPRRSRSWAGTGTRGVPGRAPPPRREDHRDLRGNERGAADRDRPRAAQARRGGAGGAVSPRERDEPVRLTRIYTRGGDEGETSLGDGSPGVQAGSADRRRRRRGRRAQLPARRRPWPRVPGAVRRFPLPAHPERALRSRRRPPPVPSDVTGPPPRHR